MYVWVYALYYFFENVLLPVTESFHKAAEWKAGHLMYSVKVNI